MRKIAAAFAAILTLAGCYNKPTEFKIVDFDRQRTIYFYSEIGFQPIPMQNRLNINMPDGRVISMSDYRINTTEKNFGKTMIVEGIE